MMTINQILKYGFDNNLEIVSFGLAPNPNGFCFERHPARNGALASVEKCTYFAQLLESLSKDEIEEVRKLVFG